MYVYVSLDVVNLFSKSLVLLREYLWIAYEDFVCAVPNSECIMRVFFCICVCIMWFCLGEFLAFRQKTICLSFFR